jgi:hypothetical protein
MRKPEPLGNVNAFHPETCFWKAPNGKSGRFVYMGTPLLLKQELLKRHIPAGTKINTSLMTNVRYIWDGMNVVPIPHTWCCELVHATGLTPKQKREARHVGQRVCYAYTKQDATIMAQLENKSRTENKNPYRLKVVPVGH